MFQKFHANSTTKFFVIYQQYWNFVLVFEDHILIKMREVKKYKYVYKYKIEYKKYDYRENQLRDKAAAISYRESKITHLFKNFFEGTGKVRLIICLNPRPEDFSENQVTASYSTFLLHSSLIQQFKNYWN